MDTKEIVTKIESWIIDENDPKLKVIRKNDYDGDKNTVLLEITSSYDWGDIPIDIVKPLDYKQKIGVYSSAGFSEEQAKSFHALKPEAKEKIIMQLEIGLSITNLTAKFIPEKKNFNQIGFQEMIYFDGLSQDRIMNSVNKVLSAYYFVILILQFKNILKGPDDSSLI